MHHRLWVPLDVCEGVNLVFSINIELACALWPWIERSSTLHEESVRVLVCLTNDNVLLREAAMVAMGQIMRVLQVDGGME